MGYQIFLLALLFFLRTTSNGFSNDFTIGIIGDTQRLTYAWGGRTDVESAQRFEALTAWYKKNADSLKIGFVSHMGDLIEEPDSQIQWNVATKAMRTIRESGIPWGIAAGNHDHGNGYLQFNSNFGVEWWEGNSWYGGGYPEGKNQNQFQLVSVGTEKVLWIHLENRAKPPIISWAQSIIDKHPDRAVFVSTHDYISERGFAPYGDTLWNTLIRKNAAIQAVFCGHHYGTAYIQRRNDAGNLVHNILIDFQDETLDDLQGAVRYMEFNLKENRAYAYTINPGKNNLRITESLRPDTFEGWVAETALADEGAAHHKQEYTIDSFFTPRQSGFPKNPPRMVVTPKRMGLDPNIVIYDMKGRRLSHKELSQQEVIYYRKRYVKTFVVRFVGGGESILMGYHPVPLD